MTAEAALARHVPAAAWLRDSDRGALGEGEDNVSPIIKAAVAALEEAEPA